jgi:1,4-dihydroxy-2-naphthoate octaprenyltransferase
VNRWVAGARPRTLPASVVPVLVGTACAAGEGGVIAWRAVAAGVVALALQVGTNYANDYSDGVRGTDTARVGPVRLVASGLATAPAVKRAALPVVLWPGRGARPGRRGGARAARWGRGHRRRLVLHRRPPPYGYLGLGELFGSCSSAWSPPPGRPTQEESLSWLAVAASVPVGFLATALLVVNNLRTSRRHDLGQAHARRPPRRPGTRAAVRGLLVGAVVMVPGGGAGQRPAALRPGAGALARSR